MGTLMKNRKVYREGANRYRDVCEIIGFVMPAGNAEARRYPPIN